MLSMRLLQTYAMVFTLPIVAALIGWITNYVAVRMLFRPRRPVRFLFLTWHGVFPKRQPEIAKKISSIIASELLSGKDIEGKLVDRLHSREVRGTIEDHIETALRQRISSYLPLLPERMSNSLMTRLRSIYSQELDGIMSSVVNRVTENAENIVDVKSTIEERIAAFPVEKLEVLAQAVLSKEFRSIELIGGGLGFLIGLVQWALLEWL